MTGIPVPGDNPECEAEQDLGYDTLLVCNLKPGHDGPHWDYQDGIEWQNRRTPNCCGYCEWHMGDDAIICTHVCHKTYVEIPYKEGWPTE